VRFVAQVFHTHCPAGIFSPKPKTNATPVAAVVHTFQAPAPVSQKAIAALGAAAVAAAAAEECGPTSYDISNDCNRYAYLQAVCSSCNTDACFLQRRRMQRQREQHQCKEAGKKFAIAHACAFFHTEVQHAVWSKKEILLPMLKRQATTNPDHIFGKCPTSVDLAAVFHKEKPRKRRYSQVGWLAGCLCAAAASSGT
jgi:hypothetical protein